MQPKPKLSENYFWGKKESELNKFGGNLYIDLPNKAKLLISNEQPQNLIKN